MGSWAHCQSLLVIRADNMGDLLLSSPAIRALKAHLNCKITVLTSSRAAAITGMIPEIDEVMVQDVPWVKLPEGHEPIDFVDLIAAVKAGQFDACVIFTVYSQNPMPAILLAFQAGIPLRLAYCRENPYHLLSNWVPDAEPFQLIKHQVLRDLDLVSNIGAKLSEPNISVLIDPGAMQSAFEKASDAGVLLNEDSFYILHPGVSELKRHFPTKGWIDFATRLSAYSDKPIILTGTRDELQMGREIAAAVGEGCYALAGLFSLTEFAALLAAAKGVVTVNTGTVHLAAAVQTPVVVLYAQTNPQHGPWQVKNKVLEYSVPLNLKSKNEVIRWVDQQVYQQHKSLPEADDILAALVAIT